MNTKLVDSLVQFILSLSQQERSLLEEKLFFTSSEPTKQKCICLNGAFDFLADEPDLYSLEDGEPI